MMATIPNSAIFISLVISLMNRGNPKGMNNIIPKYCGENLSKVMA